MNFNEIGLLLHIKEKLLGHPKLAAITAHVDAALEQHAKEAADNPPERLPTEQELAEARRAELALQNEEQRRREEEEAQRVALDNEAERLRAEQEQHRQLNADDDLKRAGQPRVPEPSPQQDLSRMNNPPENRVETRLNPQASEPAPEPVIKRKI